MDLIDPERHTWFIRNVMALFESKGVVGGVVSLGLVSFACKLSYVMNLTVMLQ